MAESDPLAVPDGLADEAIDDLYVRPLDEFTAARNALTKELRADGKVEAAAWVKSLKKPTAAAWAVNQLVRREPSRVAELRDAGAELSRLQGELLKGQADGQQLRAAQQREREIVAELAGRVKGLDPGAGAALGDKVRDTLHAAGLDHRVRDLIAVGRLSREQVAVGLGPVGAGASAESAESAATTSSAKSKHTAALRKKLKQAERQQLEGGRKVEAATEAAAEARRALEKAEREAQRATAAVKKATAAQEAADARVADLHAEISKLA